MMTTTTINTAPASASASNLSLPSPPPPLPPGTLPVSETYSDSLLKAATDELEFLRNENKSLQLEILRIREQNVSQQLNMEQEEEYITNKLFQNISSLQKENAQLIQREKDEELLQSSLHKQIYEIQRDKVDLENALEQEQEFLVNKINAHLDQVLGGIPKNAPGSTPLPSNHRRRNSNASLSSLELSLSTPSLNTNPLYGHLPSTTAIDTMRIALNSLHFRMIVNEKAYEHRIHEMTELNQQLSDENFLLKQRLYYHSENLGKLSSEKEQLINAFESSSERLFHFSTPPSGDSVTLQRSNSLHSSEKRPLFSHLPVASALEAPPSSNLEKAAENYLSLCPGLANDKDLCANATVLRSRSISIPNKGDRRFTQPTGALKKAT